MYACYLLPLGLADYMRKWNNSQEWQKIYKYQIYNKIYKIYTSIYKIYKIQCCSCPALPRGAGSGPARSPRGRAGPTVNAYMYFVFIDLNM